MDEVLFFASPEAFREWLAAHAGDTQEQWVGYYKKSTGKPSITWPESVDEALCYGWIDGLRKTIDAESYKIRFTPRKKSSIWSAVNIKRVAELTELGRMHPAGLKIFAERKEEKSGVYAYEQRENAELEPTEEAQLRANAQAWEFFHAQPTGYRKTAIWWVVSAKQAPTRLKRLNTLIETSAQGQRLPQFVSPGKRTA